MAWRNVCMADPAKRFPIKAALEEIVARTAELSSLIDKEAEEEGCAHMQQVFESICLWLFPVGEIEISTPWEMELPILKARQTTLQQLVQEFITNPQVDQDDKKQLIETFRHCIALVQRSIGLPPTGAR